MSSPASVEAGEDMRPFFERYVDGTEELPVPELLQRMGVTVTQKPPGDDAPYRDQVFSGLELSGTRVRNVLPESPAQAAGLMFEDEIVAVDGVRVDDAEDVYRRLAHRGPNERASIALFRDERLLQRGIELAAPAVADYEFALADDIPDDVRALREAWLEVFDAAP